MRRHVGSARGNGQKKDAPPVRGKRSRRFRPYRLNATKATPVVVRFICPLCDGAHSRDEHIAGTYDDKREEVYVDDLDGEVA